MGQAGRSVLVLEQAPGPYSPMKVLPLELRGLSAPTIESFDRRYRWVPEDPWHDQSLRRRQFAIPHIRMGQSHPDPRSAGHAHGGPYSGQAGAFDGSGI
jgi:hypothetical protein